MGVVLFFATFLGGRVIWSNVWRGGVLEASKGWERWMAPKRGGSDNEDDEGEELELPEGEGSCCNCAARALSGTDSTRNVLAPVIHCL